MKYRIFLFLFENVDLIQERWIKVTACFQSGLLRFDGLLKCRKSPPPPQQIPKKTTRLANSTASRSWTPSEFSPFSPCFQLTRSFSKIGGYSGKTRTRLAAAWHPGRLVLSPNSVEGTSTQAMHRPLWDILFAINCYPASFLLLVWTNKKIMYFIKHLSWSIQPRRERTSGYEIKQMYEIIYITMFRTLRWIPLWWQKKKTKKTKNNSQSVKKTGVLVNFELVLWKIQACIDRTLWLSRCSALVSANKPTGSWSWMMKNK